MIQINFQYKIDFNAQKMDPSYIFFDEIESSNENKSP